MCLLKVATCLPSLPSEPTKKYWTDACNFTVADFSKTGIVGLEKSQNESSPNFSNFCPEFCPEFLSEFSPNFLRSFRASFRGTRRPEKIHQKSPPFFNAKFPGKHEKNIHKILLESRQSNDNHGSSGSDSAFVFWEDMVPVVLVPVPFRFLPS